MANRYGFERLNDRDLQKQRDIWESREKATRQDLNSIQDTLQEIKNEQYKRFNQEMRGLK